MLKYKKIFDISPLVSGKTAVFPGDQKWQRSISMDTSKGDHITLSSVLSTMHIGAHADAENHYHAKGKGIEGRNLASYLGPCQVIRTQPNRSGRISYEEIAKIPIRAPRVLFATGSFTNPNHWQNEFRSLTPELIKYLKKKKVCLIGIDTPSVDPATEKNLISHHALYQTKICVLEGLIMKGIKPGLYHLIALPLALQGLDASPVRAVLLK